MPITVNGPNGIIINFPDGTDTAAIDQAMQRIVVDKATGEPVTAEQIKRPLTLDTAVRQVAKGMPVVGGAMENIAAAGDAATQPVLGRGSEAETFSDRYGQNLARERATDVQAEKDLPGVTTALQVGGGVAGTAPLGLFGWGQRALGLVGSLPARMAQGAAGGGALGAIDAYTREHAPELGGGVGAVVGSVAPIIGKGAGVAVEKIADVTRPIAGPIAEFARPAIKKVARAFGDDAVTPARAAELGPGSMLTDYGPNLRGQGEALATQPGSAAKRMEDAVKGRFVGADDRIISDVNRALGPPANIAEVSRFIKETRKAASDPLYEKWRSTEVPPTDALKRLAPVLEEDGLFSTAEKLMALEGKAVEKNFFTGGARKNYPTAEAWDYVKQAIDGKISETKRSGNDNVARIYTGLKTRLIEAIDNHPDKNVAGVWKQARQEFADRSALLTAQEEGQDVFKRTQRPDELAYDIKNMAGPERDAFLRGSRDAIDEMMGTVKNDALAARTFFAKEWNKRKLEILVGKDKADDLLQQIARENAFSETYGAVQRGSQTRGRLAAGEEFPNKVAPPSTQLVNPSVLGFGELALRKSLDMLRSQGRAANLDRQGADAARMLTATGDPRDALIRALQDYGQRQAQVGPTAERARNLITMLGASTPPAIQERLTR
jgi:hypothetical protein